MGDTELVIVNDPIHKNAFRQVKSDRTKVKKDKR